MRTSQEIYKELENVETNTFEDMMLRHELFLAYAAEQYEQSGEVTKQVCYYMGMSNTYLHVAENMDLSRTAQARKDFQHSKVYQAYKNVK